MTGAPSYEGTNGDWVKWCVTHDRPARGWVAAVCPNDPSCKVMDLPASYPPKNGSSERSS